MMGASGFPRQARRTMTTWIRHRYEPSGMALGAACRICGQRPSTTSVGDLWHDRDRATLAVTRWESSASAVIWWHMPLGDQPVMLRLGWLH
jgi:hypothetical protein